MSAFAATTNKVELSAMYHALDWINTRRTFPPPAARADIISDSDYCVKFFATRSIKPVTKKKIITRPPQSEE